MLQCLNSLTDWILSIFNTVRNTEMRYVLYIGIINIIVVCFCVFRGGDSNT